MSPKKTPVNHLREQHNLVKIKGKEIFDDTIATICKMLGISVSTYYRKLSNPDAFSDSDKTALAKIFKQPVYKIFPEMEINA